MSKVIVYGGEALGQYHFGADHPFGPKRLPAFWDAFEAQGLATQVDIGQPTLADISQIELFHTRDYIQRVKQASETGSGYLDQGDTPAFKGVFEAASMVVGTVLDAIEHLMQGNYQRAFVPIAGLHHARREQAAGFCVFNDCGVAIETLRQVYDIERIAYVDIDAHHGDGVFYSFENDPHVIFADLHEDGRFLYPGTGFAHETGKGEAKGTKLNIPMPPGADDSAFMQAWENVESFIESHAPEFIILHCGADSLAGDPITHMQYSAAAHAHASRRLCMIANKHSKGRLLALGGGGYDLDNIAAAWCAVVAAMIET